MYSSILESARNSTFRNPFLTTAKCEAADNSTQQLVAGRTIGAAAVAEGGITPAFFKSKWAFHSNQRNFFSFTFVGADSCAFGSTQYFVYCGIGGIISCGTTHTMVVPLDLVKCRLQVDAAKYKSVFNGFRVTLAEDGVKGLSKGWSPTFIGYSLQGLCKFGLYEVFKVLYGGFLNEEQAYLYRTGLYLVSSASAEFFADIALSPWEAAKVRIQTQPGFANTLREALPKMNKAEGMSAFYKGLVPLWCRQIPYTMMKFASFERTLELLYQWVDCVFLLACRNCRLFFYFVHCAIRGVLALPTDMLCRNHGPNAPRVNSWPSPLRLATSLACSVPLSRIRPTRLCPNWMHTRARRPWMWPRNWDGQDCGPVSFHVSSWLVRAQEVFALEMPFIVSQLSGQIL